MILSLGTSAVERTYTQFRYNSRLKNSRKKKLLYTVNILYINKYDKKNLFSCKINVINIVYYV